MVYSDATGRGACAAVIVHPSGRAFFCRHQFPRARLKRLKTRQTQVIAFELWAAAMALLTFVIKEKLVVRHFIDNRAALSCLVRAYSSHRDLNNIAGGVMHKCSLAVVSAFFDFVRSKDNLADGPSRDVLSLMEKIHAHEVAPIIPEWDIEGLDWLLEQ